MTPVNYFRELICALNIFGRKRKYIYGNKLIQHIYAKGEEIYLQVQ